MHLRFEKFSDPMYSSDLYAEFEAADVMAVEERQVSLVMRGRFQVTYVTLKSGAEHVLKGQVAKQIEAAKAESGVAAPGQ